MALPTAIAVNQTAGDILIDDLGLTVPASSQITLTDFVDFWEVSGSQDLESEVAGGNVLINDGTSTLTLAESQAFLDITGNLNGPTSATSANQIVVFSDTTGRYVENSNATLSGGTLTLSGNLIPNTSNTYDIGSNSNGWQYLFLSEEAAAPTTAVGIGAIYIKNDTPSTLHYVDDAGTDFELMTTAGDHSGLSNLAWTSSGHTGTASRIAGFSGAGAAAEYQIGTDLQAWDTDLDGLAGLGTTGIITRTGVGAFSTRTIVSSTGGITVTNGNGVSGNPSLAIIQSTESLIGGLEIATQAETDAGTDDLRAITPLKLINASLPAQGARKGMQWTFSTTTTDADPGTATFRLNNATQSSATFIYIDDVGDAGADMGTIIGNLKTNDRIYIQQIQKARHHIFRVNGTPTDGTGYWKVPVVSEVAGTALQNNAKCGLIFFETNDSGSALSQSNTVYVSKAGNDSDSGLDAFKPKLTIGSAITAAAALTPTAANRIKIEIQDAGIYAENITLGDYVSLDGPTATIDGSSVAITPGQESYIRLKRVEGDSNAIRTTSGTALTFWIDIEEIEGKSAVVPAVSATGAAHNIYINSKTIENTSGSDAISVDIPSGFISVTADKITVTGSATNCFRTQDGEARLDVGILSFDAVSATGIRVQGTSTLCYVRADALLDGASTSGIGILVDDTCTVWAYVGDINANTTYDTQTSGTIYLFAGNLTGTSSGSGTESVSEAGASGGTFSGTTGAIDNALLRANGTGGSIIQGGATNNSVLLNDTGDLYPEVNDGGSLGVSGTFQWGGLFLSSAAQIGWDSGDVTIDHAANSLTIAGATSGYTFNDGPIFIEEQAAALTDQAGKGQFWVRNDTPNTPMFTDDSGTDYELNASQPATLITQTNSVYVSKAGSDSDTGLTLNDPKLTITSAITAASALTPSSTNRVTIYIQDGGIYAEACNLPDYVSLVGPGASLTHTSNLVTMGVESTLHVHRIEVTGTGTGRPIIIDTAGECWINVDEIIANSTSGSAAAIYTGASGIKGHLNIGRIEVTGGVGIWTDNSTSARFDGSIGEILVNGSGWGFYLEGTSQVDLNIGKMSDAGSGDAFALFGSAVANVTVGECNFADNWRLAAGTTLNMFVSNLVGGVGGLNSGTANITEAGVDDNTTITQTNAIYVSKAGSDSNAGTDPELPKLTLLSAISAASSLTPSASNRITIFIQDAGIYSETGPYLNDYVSLIGPGATLSCNFINLGLETTLHLHRVIATSAGIVALDSGDHWVKVDLIENAGNSSTSCIRTSNSSSVIYMEIGKISIADGVGVYLTNGNSGTFIGNIGEIDITGNGWGIYSYSNGTLALQIGRIIGAGTSKGIVLSGSGIAANLTIGEFATNTTYAVGASSTLNLFANSISGSTGTVSGTVNLIVADDLTLADVADSDGDFLVGTGSGWVAESGSTARTSIGLGATDDVTFGSVIINEAAAGPTIAAGEGGIWIKNEAPSIPMVTNDAGDEEEILHGRALKRSSDLSLTDDVTWEDVFSVDVPANGFYQFTLDIAYNVNASDDIEIQIAVTGTVGRGFIGVDSFDNITTSGTLGWATNGSAQLRRIGGYIDAGASGGSATVQARKQTNVGANGTVFEETNWTIIRTI